MKKCDQLLYEQSNAVDEALNLLKDNDRAFVSQFSLLPLRHFVEHVMLKIYCEDCDIDMNDDWQNIKAAQEYIYTHGQYYFISEFHQNHLQKSVSHKVESKKYSETLLILYYKPLLIIKNYLLQTYRMDVLKNLSKYPLDLDNTFLDYYRVIQKAVFKSHIIEIDTWNGTNANYPTKYTDCTIVIDTYSGDNIEYTIYFDGDPKEGTSTISGGTPTFTPTASL